MIVKDGRKIILSGSWDEDNLLFFLEKKTSESEALTVPDMEYSDIEDKILDQENEKLSSIINVTIDKDTSSSLTLTIEATINNVTRADEGGISGTYIAAGLLYKDGNTKKLFSRVTFKETTLSAGSTYKMTYVIYF